MGAIVLRIGGGHRTRKAIFLQGIRQGFLNVDEVEEVLPAGLMTAAERWLFYFSLRSAEVELRDSQGRSVTPDDVVPEHRRRQRRTPPPVAQFDPADVLLDDQLP